MFYACCGFKLLRDGVANSMQPTYINMCLRWEKLGMKEMTFDQQFLKLINYFRYVMIVFIF